MRWGNLSQSIITSVIYIILGGGFLVYLYLIKTGMYKKAIKNKKVNVSEIDGNGDQTNEQ